MNNRIDIIRNFTVFGSDVYKKNINKLVSIARWQLRKGNKVLIISLETSKEDILNEFAFNVNNLIVLNNIKSLTNIMIKTRTIKPDVLIIDSPMKLKNSNNILLIKELIYESNIKIFTSIVLSKKLFNLNMNNIKYKDIYKLCCNDLFREATRFVILK